MCERRSTCAAAALLRFSFFFPFPSLSLSLLSFTLKTIGKKRTTMAVISVTKVSPKSLCGLFVGRKGKDVCLFLFFFFSLLDRQPTSLGAVPRERAKFRRANGGTHASRIVIVQFLSRMRRMHLSEDESDESAEPCRGKEEGESDGAPSFFSRSAARVRFFEGIKIGERDRSTVVFSTPEGGCVVG